MSDREMHELPCADCGGMVTVSATAKERIEENDWETGLQCGDCMDDLPDGFWTCDGEPIFDD